MGERLIGRTKDELDTPALLVDLDALEANIAKIAGTCRQYGVDWRPHSKAHKTPEIARMQIDAGAIGVTCAKLGEAEAMAEAGITDIMIANQIVGPAKIARLIALLGSAKVSVAVDGPANVAALGEAAWAAGRTLRVLIEVDVGMRRAGVLPGEPVRELAGIVKAQRGLRLAGVMGWEAHAIKLEDPAVKERTVREAIAELRASAEACRSEGQPPPILSCGGTGTFPFCIMQPGVTEVQVGGGMFGDVLYRDQFHVAFPPALTVLTTVTSRPTPSRIILDAGKKALSSDGASPEPRGVPGVRALALSAEHATIELEADAVAPVVGDHVELAVGYSDTTVHLHEWMLGVRRGKVETAWRVAGRGRLS